MILEVHGAHHPRDAGNAAVAPARPDLRAALLVMIDQRETEFRTWRERDPEGYALAMRPGLTGMFSHAPRST